MDKMTRAMKEVNLKRNVLLTGRAGSGKSAAIKKILARIREDKAIILDRKGEFFEEFYDPARDVKLDIKEWNFFLDIKNRIDIEAFVEAVIPEVEPIYWSLASRAALKRVLGEVRLQERPSPAKLFRAIQEDQELNSSNGKPTQAALIITLSWMEHISEDASFSISSWIANEAPGFLYLPGWRDYAETPKLEAAITALVEMAAVKAFNRSIPARSVYFILDEMMSLKELKTLQPLLSYNMAFGAHVVATVPDPDLLKHHYGGAAELIVKAFGTVIECEYTRPTVCSKILRFFKGLFRRR